MNNRFFFDVVKLIIYIGIITALVFFIYWERNKFSVLADIPMHKLFVLLISGTLPVFFNAMAFKINTSIFDIYLKFREWAGLSILNTFYNYIFPARSGMAVRIGYMKKRYDFPVSSYLSLLTGSYLIIFFVSALTATLLSLSFYLLDVEFQAVFFYLSLGLLIFTISLFLLMKTSKVSFLNNNNKISQFLQNSFNGLQLFKSNKKKIKYLVLCKFFFLLTISLRLYFSFSVLGIHISYAKILLTCSFFVFSMFLSIAPGNFGIKEGIIGISTTMMGVPAKEAMMGAVLDRVVSMIIIFSLGVVFHYVLFLGKKRPD